MVDEFVGAAERHDVDMPPVVFVYQGTADQGPMFFERLAPDAVAVADPDGVLYAAAQVPRGGLREMFGLRSWIAGLRATRKGHRIGRKVGDPWTLPTVLAVRGRTIIGEFTGDHAGDHPDPVALADFVRTAGEARDRVGDEVTS